LKFYLAGRYSRAAELCNYRHELEMHGHTVTSRWLNGGHQIQQDTVALSVEAANSERRRFALEDWSDLMEAEIVISFTEEPRTTNGRGGRHVEFGAALAVRKPCIIIGPRENVFHYYPGIEHYETWTQFVRGWFPGWEARP
jgi:hypothetical protein